MGKKSKAARAKAKAGAGDGSSGSKGGGGTGGGGGGGAMVTSNKKAQKCVRCFGTVKADKGTACPGCSLVYCWRCEKKAFDECPNGSDCVHPLRRCGRCVGCDTFVGVMEEKEGVNYRDLFDFKAFEDAFGRFEQYIEQDEALSPEALPLVTCTGVGCIAQACYHCCFDPTSRSIVSCINRDECGTIRCMACRNTTYAEVGDKLSEDDDLLHHLTLCGAAMKLGLPPPTDSMRKLMKMIKTIVRDAIIVCDTCPTHTCVSCMDDRSLTSVAVSLVRSVSLGEATSYFQCSRCYWSTKPCTNPSCPNDIGVPTKRCGACHIDRYCSVECQAAAYPAHVNRCNKIQATRVAFAAAATAQVEKEGQGGD